MILFGVDCLDEHLDLLMGRAYGGQSLYHRKTSGLLQLAAAAGTGTWRPRG